MCVFVAPPDQERNVFDCFGARYCVVLNCIVVVYAKLDFGGNGKSRHSENPIGKQQKGTKN